MKNILGKTWIIGIMILFVGASVLPSISANIEEAGDITLKQELAHTDIIWSEDFDSYDDGSSMHGQGGWEGWENNPTWTAYVTSDQSHSSPRSVDIVGDADLVHQFSGVDYGVWNFTCFVYIPIDFTGMSYFILLNTYGSGIHNWSTQLKLDSDEGIIYSEFEGEQLWLVYDQWVELRVQIDFDADNQQIYYDGVLLSSKSWTEGVSGGGALNLGAVDLFANAATTVYYDDFTLDGPPVAGPDLDCAGDLNWVNVTPGATVTGTFTVENIGAAESLLDWEIESYPDWGTWTFDPESGEDLTPEDGAITIEVDVIAPDEEEKTFTGEIKIVNSEDSDDYCTIPVSLVTPVSQQQSLILQFLERLADRFPRLGNLLGL